MSALKVVHYAPTWLPQTQTWMHNQLRFLPPEVETHVVCRSTRHLDQFPVANLHSLKDDSPLGYGLHRLATLMGRRQGFAYLGQQLDRLRPDVMHSHFGNNGWTVHRDVARRGLPHFVTFYGQDVSRLPQTNPAWRERYRDLFADKTTRFLCEGTAMGLALERLGCPAEKIAVQHLGVELGGISFTPRHWQAGQTLKVLIAAGFREKKGISYALQALGRLHRELPISLTLIGDADPSASAQQEKQRILAALEQGGLTSVTRLLGYQPYSVLLREAAEHHLFVSTSVTASDGDTEGGAPVSLIDMSASGMPIVSSVHCDIPEIVRHGETGWLAAERDVEGIWAALHRWVDAPQTWPGMLAAARRHIETEYDAVRQGQRLAAHYRAALG